MEGMMNYVVKCIKDDGDIKLCVGKQTYSYQPNQAEIKELMARFPGSSFAVVVPGKYQSAVSL